MTSFVGEEDADNTVLLGMLDLMLSLLTDGSFGENCPESLKKSLLLVDCCVLLVGEDDGDERGLRLMLTLLLTSFSVNDSDVKEDDDVDDV
jgi:hypothetical protein